MAVPLRPLRSSLLVTRSAALVALSGAAIAAVNACTIPRLHARRVTEPVTVVVPARNEESRIGDLVADLRRQTLLDTLRVIVLDDDSADRTAAVATSAFAGDGRFALVPGDGPPPGWLGKNAACHEGATRAARLMDPARPGVLVFLDADVRLAADALAAAVTALRDCGADLVSPWPRQDAATATERLIQPLLCWSWFSTLPVTVANRSTRPSTVVACGQFLVFDAAAYYRMGGHAPVAGSHTEDLDIARAVRRRGGRTVVAAAQERAHCRMYTDADALRDGYTRWLWTAFGSPAGAAVVTTLVAATYAVPPLAMLFGRGRTRVWGTAGYLAAIASRVTARAVERGSPPSGRDVADAAAHPVSVAAFVRLVAVSHRDRRRRRLQWKGRQLT
ncbi:glycosyl transferase [Prescottella equi]|uniref:glycosyltransferase n=1 Tax=Rhodococcus hoagii TaxID=43767 RepID=UPI000A11946F|nr:glycosyltransferase family A protein [Prescottella equi]ORL34861.1 glycosyl transferase [Prescottella equi]ORL92844.1 glycosyl transferase [Prescottella equi]ORM20719.1 glycosyl transferase [Prescottella equi]